MRKNCIVQKKSMHIRRGGSRKPKMTEMTKRERMRKIRLVLLWISGIAIAGASVYFLFFSPYAEMQTVNIQGESGESFREDVSVVVKEYLDGKKGWIFSRRNFFFFSESELRQILDERFSPLTRIEVKKQFPTTLRIKFSERVSVAVWCGSVKCFHVDVDGYAFSEVSDASENVLQAGEKSEPVVSDNPREEKFLRDTVIRKEVLAQFLEWDDFLKRRLGGNFSALYIDEPENFQEYHVRTERGWDIRVAKNIPLEETFQSLYSFLQTLPTDRKEKLQSLDLRIEGKIFFTEKKDEGQITEVPVVEVKNADVAKEGEKKDEKKKD